MPRRDQPDDHRLPQTRSTARWAAGCSLARSYGGAQTVRMTREDRNIWPGLTYDDPLAIRAWLAALG